MRENFYEAQGCKTIDYYKKKHCLTGKWSSFRDCCIYFYLVHSINADLEVLLDLMLRRLKLEVSMCGGKISNELSQATHLVVLSVLRSDIDIDTIFKSFSASERRALLSTRLHIVGHQWLEDSLDKDQKLPEEAYSMKSLVSDNMNFAMSKDDLETPTGSEEVDWAASSSSPKGDKLGRGRSGVANKISAIYKRGRNPKRGRPTRKNRISTRVRPRNKLVQIDEEDSENSASSNETLPKEHIKLSSSSPEIHDMPWKEFFTAEKEEPALTDISDRKEPFEFSDKIHQIEMDHENDTKDSMQVEGFAEGLENNDGTKDDSTQKLEVMVDPLQAMLLDMIPTLGTNKTNDSSKYVKESEEPKLDPGAEPVKKKKKVSYKDVAHELLKDW